MHAKKTTQLKKRALERSRVKRSTGAIATAQVRNKKVNTAKLKRMAMPKRISALEAAALVLKTNGGPMRVRELIDAMSAKGLWASPNGKTPHATLSAALQREIDAKGSSARFAKAGPGLFTYSKEGQR